MSDYKTDIVPDRPLNWTLASESQIKKLPSLQQMWAEWRATKTWDYNGMPLPIDQINTYFEMQEEPGL